MDYKVTALGFFVGFLVGLTGMGGGALMTPMLILLGWARPVVAVGTDLVWGTLTKATGAFVHARQKTVDFSIVKRLAIGSVPGALLGLLFLSRLNTHGDKAMDQMVVRLLGIALMCVALMLFLRPLRIRKQESAQAEATSDRFRKLTPVLGFVVGFLVSLTSVGSGSMIIACLVMVYPHTPLKRIVGSDIVHALILVGISALGHIGIGSVNVPLLGALLIGSIPGVWLGSKSTALVPEKVLRPALATLLFILGYKLL